MRKFLILLVLPLAGCGTVDAAKWGRIAFEVECRYAETASVIADDLEVADTVQRALNTNAKLASRICPK